ncbi:MAG: hypothetical protein JSW26_25340 [Desulfobacterales bacterium]|nr:MAG: hypothetical protein JSW26_25340 [Desulfobacterales bacterium]
MGLSEAESNLDTVFNCLAEKKQRSVLALETYATFGLMDTWLHQKFLPFLSDNVFTIIAGRQASNAAWLTTPGWSEFFREIKLGEFSSEDALKMLAARGLRPDQIERVRKFAKGFPLALEM